MDLITLIAMVALAQYIFFVGRVGGTRGKYKVPAPKTTGNETWERYFRIQQNTLEQLVIFIPALYGFATYVSATWALLPGVLFIIGRALFSFLYSRNPEKRAPGMVLSFFSNIALVLGTLIGVCLKLV